MALWDTLHTICDWVRHAVTSRQQQQLADRPLGIGADVVMPDADGCDFSERRNRSNDEHVGMTSLKNGKQRASETMCRTSTKLTFKQHHERHNSQHLTTHWALITVKWQRQCWDLAALLCTLTTAVLLSTRTVIMRYFESVLQNPCL